ncbi:MAG: response regulator transcription factor [Candidatus Nanopelagicales bacterium]
MDDQPEFRLVARQLLEADEFVVLGEAPDGNQAISAERLLRPEVVLMDVRLGSTSGLNAARAMSRQTSPPVVVLTSTADYTSEVESCGAAGFIPKARLSGGSLRALLEGL